MDRSAATVHEHQTGCIVGMTRISPVHPPDGAGWDRAAELKAIQDTYARYERTDRARLWDQHQPGYARLVESLQASLIASLVSSVPASGGRVLDLGCGEGELAVGLASLAPSTEWIGLDLREEAIDIARARFPELRFIVASADAGAPR